jgi:hypothetical protein
LKRDFDLYMSARRQGGFLPEWFDVYDAANELQSYDSHRINGTADGGMNGSLTSELKDDKSTTLLVDVGGGRGHDVAKFRKKFATLRGQCILQDLPETITAVRASGNVPEGVELQAYNFFDPQPVQGVVCPCMH